MRFHYPRGPIMRHALRLTAILLSVQASPAAAAPATAAEYAEAQALFRAHCSIAGERIERTVDEVEGIFLLKLRTTLNRSNQLALDDPYGSDLTGPAYIEGFLREKHPPSPQRAVFFASQATRPANN